MSDTSSDTDRVKASTYAGAGIPAYWLVNLVDGCVEVSSGPRTGSDPHYASRIVRTRGELLDLELDETASAPTAVGALLP